MAYEYDFVSATDAKTFQKDVQKLCDDTDPGGPWEIINQGVTATTGASAADGGASKGDDPFVLYWVFVRRTHKKAPTTTTPTPKGAS